MEVNRLRFKYALFFLFYTAAIGILLRFQFITTPFITFGNFLHGHSHVAMLGWLFNSFFIFIIYLFIPEHALSRHVRILFWLFQLSVFGMLISFPIQGYKAVSITFSTLHLLLSYYFIYLFFQLMDMYPERKIKNSLSLKFVYSSLILLAVSSIGPWALAVFMVRGGNASMPFYNMAIYFYLHFLYNGFFTFGIIGFIINILENKGVQLDLKLFNRAFIVLIITVLPAYTHSLLGFTVPSFVYYTAIISSFLELMAVRYIFGDIYSKREIIFKDLSKSAIILFRIGILCFVIKYVLQVLSVLPVFKDFVFVNRDLVIGYLHLSLLGFLSFTTLSLSEKFGLIDLNLRLNKFSVYLLVLGFVIMEFLLFLPGLNMLFSFGYIPYYHIYIFSVSVLMFIGISIIFFKYLVRAQNY